MRVIYDRARCVNNVDRDLIFCDCKKDSDHKEFPTLKFEIGGLGSQHWFELRGRDYMFYDPSQRKCAVLVKPELNANMRMWLMGDPFLRAYYSIYDMDNKRIGLVSVADKTRSSYAPDQLGKGGSCNKVMGGNGQVLGEKDNSRSSGGDDSAQDDITKAVLAASGGSCCLIFILIPCCLCNPCKKKEESSEKYKEEEIVNVHAVAAGHLAHEQAHM